MGDMPPKGDKPPPMDGDGTMGVEMSCYACKIEWDKDGYRMFYDLSKSMMQIEECPMVMCDRKVPGGACAKATWSMGTSNWEYRNCSSTYHNVCKMEIKSTAEDCKTDLHCTTDGCNGYIGDATVSPPPSRKVVVVYSNSGVRVAVNVVVILTGLWVFG